MKRLILIFLLISFLGAAQDITKFDEGNAFYNSGDYASAVKVYEEILNSGFNSSELYYNLANSYYKQNKVGPSVYYYEKALILDPGDSDILNNLGFARKMTIDEIDEVPELGVLNILNKITNIFSLDGWALMCISFMILFVGLFIGYYLSYAVRKKRVFFVLVFFSFLMLTASYFAMEQKNIVSKKENFAILFSQEAQLKVEPNLKSESVIVLHEGTKIQLLDTFQLWTKIKLKDGKTGWLPSNTFKVL